MRIIRLALIGIVLSLFFSAAACPGTRDPATPDAKYIEYGKAFHYIVRLTARDLSNDRQQFASAVLIKPHWALTAAHVVHNTKDVAILMRDDKVLIKIPYVIAHKDFDPGTPPGFHDIALCYSEKDFGLDFYPELYSDLDEESQVCSISGYGLHGDFNTGAIAADIKRRAGSNKIDRIEHAVLICTPSRRDRTALEYLICSGDSGGGLFLGNKLAGINSFVMCETGRVPDSRYGNEAAHTRVSLYREWVREQIELHELRIQGKITTSANPHSAPEH